MSINAEFANYKEGLTVNSGAAITQWALLKMSGANAIMTSAVTDTAFTVACRAASAANELIPTARIGSYVWVYADGAVGIGAFVIPGGTTAGAVQAVGTATTAGTICYVGQMVTAAADTQLAIMLLAPHLYKL